MGGREHDLAMAGPYPDPTEADLEAVLRARRMLLPSLMPQAGPYPGRSARWLNEPAPGTAERGAAVAAYLALVTAQSLSLIGHRGPLVVEGPFARNRSYLAMLAVAAACEVQSTGGTTGTSQGAALLAAGLRPRALAARSDAAAPAIRADLARAYIADWRRRVDGA